MIDRYAVRGMTCGGCARAVETAIKAQVPGVQVSVDQQGGVISIVGATGAQVAQAVEKAGFEFGGKVE